MLNLIVGESEDIKRKEYASYTLDGFKIGLAYGNLLRFSIINSGNLNSTLKRRRKGGRCHKLNAQSICFV